MNTLSRDYARDNSKRLLCAGENFLRTQEIVEVCIEHIIGAFAVGLVAGYLIWEFPW